MPSCSTPDCAAPVVVDWSVDCDGGPDCPDPAAAHHAEADKQTAALGAALERYAAACVVIDGPADPDDADAAGSRAQAIADRADATSAALNAEHAATVAQNRAAGVSGPHTHPRFGCDDHAPVAYREALANEETA
jgi:hypothetical protein